MDLIEQMYEDSKNNPKPESVPLLERGLLYPYSDRELHELLSSIETMKEDELFNLLCKEYKLIFKQIFRSNSSEFYFLLNSAKFLTVVTQVIKSVNDINSEDVVHFNSFIYNYLVSTDNIDSYVYRLLFDLGEALNKKIVRRLYGCEIGEDLSIFLAISSRSTFKSLINIKRLNFTLATASPQMVTQKKSIEIYSALFDYASDLIIGTIFDTDIISNYSQDWVTDEVKMADYNITIAVLTILESMVPYELTKVLLAISCEYSWRGCNPDTCKIKFDKLNPNVFPKITVIRQQLEGEGKVFP